MHSSEVRTDVLVQSLKTRFVKNYYCKSPARMMNLSTYPNKQPCETEPRSLSWPITFTKISGVLSAKVGDYYFDDGEMSLDMTETGAM